MQHLFHKSVTLCSQWKFSLSPFNLAKNKTVCTGKKLKSSPILQRKTWLPKSQLWPLPFKSASSRARFLRHVSTQFAKMKGLIRAKNHAGFHPVYNERNIHNLVMGAITSLPYIAARHETLQTFCKENYLIIFKLWIINSIFIAFFLKPFFSSPPLPFWLLCFVLVQESQLFWWSLHVDSISASHQDF